MALASHTSTATLAALHPWSSMSYHVNRGGSGRVKPGRWIGWDTTDTTKKSDHCWMFPGDSTEKTPRRPSGSLRILCQGAFSEKRPFNNYGEHMVIHLCIYDDLGVPMGTLVSHKPFWEAALPSLRGRKPPLPALRPCTARNCGMISEFGE
jgi:hypothetical protein